jgi:hypothetical protein
VDQLIVAGRRVLLMSSEELRVRLNPFRTAVQFVRLDDSPGLCPRWVETWKILTHDEFAAVVADAQIFYAACSPSAIAEVNVMIEASDKADAEASREAPPSSRRVPQRGWVYIVKIGKAYKIGCTRGLKGRLQDLVSGYPRLKVVHTISSHDIRKLEQRLHQQFHARHIDREWFALTAEDIAWLKDTFPSELVT